MKQMSLSLVLALVGVMFLLGVAIIELYRAPYTAFGSVGITDEYQATSTGSSAVRGSSALTSGVIRTGQGSLGNVNLLGATAGGELNFFDATTTDITKRATGQSTSTILIATIPATALGGTYAFDIEYTTALMYDVPVGTVPTTTISFR